MRRVSDDSWGRGNENEQVQILVLDHSRNSSDCSLYSKPACTRSVLNRILNNKNSYVRIMKVLFPMRSD